MATYLQAAGSRVIVGLVPETDYGVTPTTPQMQLLELVSFSGDLNADQLTDPSIRPDRQTSYSRRGNVSATGELVVVLAPDNYDSLIEAALQGTWTSDEVAIGTTQRSFAIEQGFSDIDQFRVFNGCIVNTFSMEVNTTDLVQATFGLFAANTSGFSATELDATPTAVTEKSKFFHENGTFVEGGVTVGYLSAISFELNNNVTGNYALGALGYRSVTSGKVNVTGTVTALFESVAFYNKFKNNEESSLSFTLITEEGETLQFNFPRVKYTSGSIPVSGDAGITVEMGFEAIYDAAEGTTMTVVRGNPA